MKAIDFGLEEQDLATIKSILSAYNTIEKAVIFGSRATGNYRPGSDVDIAIYTKDKELASKISFTLNEDTLLPYHFDVIDFYSLTHQNLINQINQTGDKVFESEHS